MNQPPRTGNFPFYRYADRYEIWEYIPLDQGGRFAQLILVGSEKDADIVAALRQPSFFARWGDPIVWDALESTALENSVWLNRWYYLPCFARSQYLTGDRVYLEEWLALVRKWTCDNPVPADLQGYFATKRYNWRDMQVAWRTQNLIWCYFLCKDSLSDAEQIELHGIIETHADVLLAYFGAQPLNENNHQSHGAAAMLYAGLLFPELRQASLLIEKGIAILEHHLEHAFYADGNSVEFCPGYYPFFVSNFRDTWLLCRENGVTPPEGTETRLRQFYQFILQARQPDDTMPPINDSSESGALVSLEVLRELLEEPEDFTPRSIHFQDSHQAVMRDSTGGRDGYLFLDAGPRILAHWHSGKLGFHLWYFGRRFVVDSGICSYDLPERYGWFARPEAHNVLLVDGAGDYNRQEIDVRAKPLAACRITRWISTAGYDFATMTHDGFLNRPSPVRWARHFLFVRDGFVLLVDELASEGAHDYHWPFHCAPCSLELDPERKIALTGFEERNLAIIPAVPALFERCEITSGRVSQQGKILAAPVMNYGCRGSSLVAAFVFMPVEGAQAPEVSIRQEISSGVLSLVIESPSKSIELKLPSGEAFSAGEKSGEPPAVKIW